MIDHSEFCKRDTFAERQLLAVMDSMDYLLLQRDWDSLSHGDLDFVLHAHHWRTFIEALLKLADSNNWALVKAYEIERAVVSIVLLTSEATMFIDVAITPYRRTLFGVNLQDALDSREHAGNAFIASESDSDTYRMQKRAYKTSRRARLIRKIANLPVMLRRLCHNITFQRGAAIYIPYVVDTGILRSDAVKSTVKHNLTVYLTPKYSL